MQNNKYKQPPEYTPRSYYFASFHIGQPNLCEAGAGIINPRTIMTQASGHHSHSLILGVSVIILKENDCVGTKVPEGQKEKHTICFI